MRSKIYYLLFLTAIALLGLSGCARYKAKPLSKLNTEVALEDRQQQIAFAYHAYDVRECKRYLGRNVIAKGYQPIQITVTNNTDRTMSFSTASFNVPCVHPDEVASKVHTSTAARATWYSAGALFIWPLAIPAVIDGVGSSKANKNLNADYERKALHDQEIKAFTRINGLIFVPIKDFNQNLALTLSDKEKHTRFVLNDQTPRFSFGRA